MHLDTVLTMIDVATFVRYPYLDPDSLRTWVITPADPEEVSRTRHRRRCTSNVATTCSPRSPRRSASTRSASSSADEDARAAEREQWDDANNFLTVAPGVVVGYERNTVTNTDAARSTASRSCRSRAANSVADAAAPDA